jgi:hypothetical protein
MFFPSWKKSTYNFPNGFRTGIFHLGSNQKSPVVRGPGGDFERLCWSSSTEEGTLQGPSPEIATAKENKENPVGPAIQPDNTTEVLPNEPIPTPAADVATPVLPIRETARQPPVTNLNDPEGSAGNVPTSPKLDIGDPSEAPAGSPLKGTDTLLALTPPKGKNVREWPGRAQKLHT